MTARKFLAAAALLTAATALAQGNAHWLATNHDFGVINEADGKAVTHFSLVNTGDSALFITRVQNTCGCTATDFPRHAIAPGDTATLTVTFTPTGIPGPFGKSVMVTTTGLNRRARLHIEGSVKGTPQSIDKYYPLALGPLRLTTAQLPMGEHPRGVMRSKVVNALNNGPDTLLLSFNTGRTPHLVAHAVPDTLPPARISTITVILNTRLAPQLGFKSDEVTLRCRRLHGAAADSLPLAVTSIINEDFSTLTPEQRRLAPVARCSTATLDMGRMTRSTATATLTLTNDGHSDLMLRRLYSMDPAVTATCPSKFVKPGHSATITVTVDVAALSEPLVNATLQLITSDPEHPVTAVRVVGTVPRVR